MSPMKVRLAIVLLVGLAVTWHRHYVPGLHTANEYVRLYAVQAMAEHGTARLDPVFDRYAPTWRANGEPLNIDVAEVGGSFYADKAPLPMLLAVPVYWLAARVIDPWAHPDRMLTALTFVFGGLPLLLFTGLALRRRQQGAEDAAALFMALGTPLLLYASMWFGHLTAGLLAFAGAALLERERWLLGGLWLGAAALTDYPAAAVAGLIAGLHFLRAPTWRARLTIPLGLVLAVLGQLLYNLVVFDDPFVFAYAHKYAGRFQAIHGTGLFGVSWPNPGRWLALLFSPARGLFFLSPILLLAVPGLVLVARDRELDLGARLSPALLFVIFPLVLSGFVDWKAGACAGPRHLVSMLPFLARPLARSLAWLSERRRPIPAAGAAALGALSIGSVWLVHATFPYLSERLVNPIMHQVLPLFLAGCGFRPWLSLPAPMTSGFDWAFPLLAAGGAAALLLWDRSARARALLTVGALLGAGLALTALALPGASQREVPIAVKEAALVQELLDCPRRDHARAWLEALAPPPQGVE